MCVRRYGCSLAVACCLVIDIVCSPFLFAIDLVDVWFCLLFFFFFQAEDGIRDYKVTGVQTCALPISRRGILPASGCGSPRADRGHNRRNLAERPDSAAGGIRRRRRAAVRLLHARPDRKSVV